MRPPGEVLGLNYATPIAVQSSFLEFTVFRSAGSPTHRQNLADSFFDRFHLRGGERACPLGEAFLRRRTNLIDDRHSRTSAR